ncbi:MAG: YidC/Oxa1 family membrane protein insertase [Candidatus Nomurabacteria bacterium]|jgi:YidC/Oxa1 family membrane protein insertase|nr:YidC/Oxa1 family membrane protein insertase [Candidatus Nomurabacteria bacterium]
MNIWDLIIVQPIFNILLALYSVFRDFGLALIVFTIIVKLLLWPLAKKQLHQSRLMKKIQPELAEIKKRCNGNKQMESLQMMDLYKRNNIKPFQTMLTLIIQLPIFIAIFSIVNMASGGGEAVAKYAYGFIQKLAPVAEAIANPDFSLKLFGFVDLRAHAWPGGGFTLSAIILFLFVVASCVLQYVISKQQMPSKKDKRTFKQIMKDAAEGKQADQSELNGIVSSQMTKIMPVMMFLIMIGLPGAVVLYYLVTNIMGYVQQRMIFKQDLDEMEAGADRKIVRELNKIEEAEIVEDKTGVYKKSSGKTHITKLVAKEKGGKLRRK